MVMGGGLEVLPERDEVHIMVAQVPQGRFDLLPGFAQPKHDAGLGGDVRVLLLESLQELE